MIRVANRKLDGDEIDDLCSRYADGALVSVLARDYDISERHVRRLTVDVRRRLRVDDSVERAVVAFLADLEFTPRSQVLAESAVALGRNLDMADPRSAGGLARALIDLISEIRGDGEPDRLDLLIRRREARLLAARSGKERNGSEG